MTPTLIRKLSGSSYTKVAYELELSVAALFAWETQSMSAPNKALQATSPLTRRGAALKLVRWVS